MFRPKAAALAAVAVFWVSRPVAAAPRITWSAPDGCPAEATAASRISEEIDSASALEIDVAIREPTSEGQFTADVSIRAPHGATRRTLESPDCATLLDAVALISAAAAVELEAVEPEPEPEPEPATIPLPTAPPAADVPSISPTEPPSPPLGVAAPENDERPRRQALVAAHIRAEGIVGWGVTPSVDAGGGGAVGLTLGRLRAEVFAHALAAGTEQFAIADVRADVRAWSVGGRGCGIVGWVANDRVFFPVCGAIEGGIMEGEGEGEGLASTDSITAPWLAIRVGPAVLVQATPWLAISAMVEARATLLRPGFAVGGSTEQYQPAVVGPVGSLGVEFHFPRRKPGARRN